MRQFYLGVAALAVAACGGGDDSGAGAPELALETGTWSDGERSGLCAREDGTAAFILYAEEGEANCQADGVIEQASDGLIFSPRGDETCDIALSAQGETLTFGDLSDSCAYYCGGDTELAGRTLSRSDATNGALTDPAGDAVC